MMPKPVLVSVVIPAYNRRDSVLQLLDDVFRQTGVTFEVIVVDDCSSDDTVTALPARFPALRMLRNATNGGPAVSRNAGVRAARGEFVVGFDSDVTVPDPTLLRRVVETFARFPDADGLAFRLLTTDGSTDDAPRWWHPRPLAGAGAACFATDYFSGTGYAFRRHAMIQAGMFPEILYMHYEEVELAYRILDRGARIIYCPDLEVRHHAHPVARRGRIQKFYKPRNQILVTVACYPWARAIVYLFPRIGYNFLQAICHGHIREFGEALSSAFGLARRRLADRRPLRRETWRRIAELRRGVALDVSAESQTHSAASAS